MSRLPSFTPAMPARRRFLETNGQIDQAAMDAWRRLAMPHYTRKPRDLNRSRGLTFLIVTHDISVGRATDRIVRMVDGQIVDEELLEVAT